MKPFNHPSIGNTRIRARIDQLLPLLAEEDQRKFIRKFQQEPSEQAAHTFRELICGVFLLKNGFRARYEVLLGGKTPDWIAYEIDGKIAAVVDQLTFHQAKLIDDEMNNSTRNGSPWTGWLPNNVDRLYQKVQEKAEAYDRLATIHSAANIVSIFGDINAAIYTDEIEDALHKAYGGGVFARNPSLSGVILFHENCGNYHFMYFENPHALRRIFITEATV